jgi:hypothetical protein
MYESTSRCARILNQWYPRLQARRAKGAYRIAAARESQSGARSIRWRITFVLLVLGEEGVHEGTAGRTARVAAIARLNELRSPESARPIKAEVDPLAHHQLPCGGGVGLGVGETAEDLAEPSGLPYDRTDNRLAWVPQSRNACADHASCTSARISPSDS